MDNLFDLTGKVALVTGGNSGIGLAMASALGQAGAGVAIWGRTESRNSDAADVIGSHGGEVLALSVDVSNEAEVVDAFAATVDALGHVPWYRESLHRIALGRLEVGRENWVEAEAHLQEHQQQHICLKLQLH